MGFLTNERNGPGIVTYLLIDSTVTVENTTGDHSGDLLPQTLVPFRGLVVTLPYPWTTSGAY